MDNTVSNHDHPQDWPVEDLMIYLQYKMNYSIQMVLDMNQDEMINAVLKDEIDEE